MKAVFTKPAITPEQQIELLKQRGLIIFDEARALCFLEAVSFFRLTPYMRPFQHPDNRHQFLSGTKFSQLTRLYDFDRKLRLLIIDAVERTEVAIRAHISNKLNALYGSHWYLDRIYFKKNYDHLRLIQNIQGKQQIALDDYERECQRIDALQTADEVYKNRLKLKRQQESYARHYTLTYNDPELMPSWAMLEELSLGELSHLFKGLAKDKDKKIIASGFDLFAPLLESWLHTLTVIRNICAHHARLWNRELGIKPAYPTQKNLAWFK
ncbi:Abi family protein [Legionella sp. km772]|uniref:Abi family protein n=1 Tax=Legionella sp. km772 TaxID=2498111 RepID=UPI000F8DF12A|nr:Abi family protein [Legionella sp. km772]RUR04154.1 Abi family protein [Legionella sp. km772]